VTSQPQPGPGEGNSAGRILRDLRDIGAYVLVGVPAVLLFVAIIRLVPDGPDQFAGRTQGSFYGFVNLETIFMPLAAVLLALLVHPRHPKARLIVVAALVEYAVAAFFGVFFGLLIGLINTAADQGARAAFEELLLRLAWLALLAVPAYALVRIWQSHYPMVRPKPAAQPGVYGQPQYNMPGTYPGQPGYGPPPGQPYYPPAGPTPQPGYGQHPSAGPYPPAGYGPPTYGQSAPNPSWNQAPEPPHPGAPAGPTSAPPAPFAPRPSADPTQVVSPGTVPDETQVVPQRHPADRTQMLHDDRPGFGPAEPDPPRS